MLLCVVCTTLNCIGYNSKRLLSHCCFGVSYETHLHVSCNLIIGCRVKEDVHCVQRGVLSGVRYAKSMLIQYSSDINIFQDSLINIDIDIFKMTL